MKGRATKIEHCSLYDQKVRTGHMNDIDRNANSLIRWGKVYEVSKTIMTIF